MRALLLLPAVALLLLLPAGPAAAHASLEGGSVRDGEVLAAAPEEVFLDFNEDVSAPRAGLRVYDEAGERVDVGGTYQTPDAPDLVRVGLEPDLPDGTYVLTFRVTSADGHPIDGALVFGVGGAGADDAAAEALLAEVFAGDADRPWAVAATVARAVAYVGLLLAAGAAVVLWWLRAEVDPRGAEAAVVRRWVRRGAWAAAAATVAGLALQVVLVTGDGPAALADGAAVADVVGSFVGISALLRVLAAAGLAVLASPGRDGAPLAGPAGVGLALAGLGSFLLEGHTLTTGPAAVVWSGAAVHVVAGALWLGGLVVLAVVLRARRRADDPVGAGRVVARASALLTAAVVGVLVAGSALSWAEVRAPRALLGTPYGLVLLAKLAAVTPLVALGAWNNRRLVPVLTARRARGRGAVRPALAGGSAGTIAGGSDEVAERGAARDRAWALLGRTVRLEIAAIALVLAATSVLVALQPAAEAAGITGAFSETVVVEGLGDDGDGQMTFTVDPNRVGPNEIHLYLLDGSGRPLQRDLEGVVLRLGQPDLDIGPIERDAIRSGAGHYVLAGPELSVPGRWEIAVEVQLTRFEVVETTVEVVVNP